MRHDAEAVLSSIPESADSHALLGIGEMLRGEWQSRQGIDPRPAWRTSAAELSRAFEINGKDATPHSMRALLALMQSEYAGAENMEWIATARAIKAEARAIDPLSASARMVEAALLLAIDPVSETDAGAAYRRALELNPLAGSLLAEWAPEHLERLRALSGPIGGESKD